MNATSTELTFSITALSVLVLFAMPGTNSELFAWAESSIDQNSFTVLKGEQLNSPFAKTMLERIELMKKNIAEMQEKKNQISEHQKFIEEQRKIVKQRLDEDLNRMNNDYKDYSPKSAFDRFVSKKPTSVQDVFLGMFDYHRMKVKAAQLTMKEILDNGGSYQEARDAYNKIAATKRVDLIEVTKNLNIQYGLADEKVQQTFDKYGKLPRAG